MRNEKNKTLSHNEIERLIANAKASLAIEGMIVTDVETEIIRKYFKGELTEKEVLEIIKGSTD